jgi:hypothetical protein
MSIVVLPDSEQQLIILTDGTPAVVGDFQNFTISGARPQRLVLRTLLTEVSAAPFQGVGFTIAHSDGSDDTIFWGAPVGTLCQSNINRRMPLSLSSDLHVSLKITVNSGDPAAFVAFFMMLEWA